MMGILGSVNSFVWGVPALLLILAVGIYLTLQTRWAQLRFFPLALRAFFNSFRKTDDSNAISPYRALCTALAATVGTGNLAGVGGAIAIGGPGAIFWMWICAFLGMITKFAEVTLSVRYRMKDSCGNFVGGPMYIAQQALNHKWRVLGYVYCFFGVIAAFGVGSATQINAVVGGINGAVRALGGREAGKYNLAIGFIVAVLSVLVLLGGAKRIGCAAAFLVPFASLFYIILCGVALALCYQAIPQAFISIVKGAFCPKAVTGGILGSAFQVLRVGAARGVFTNEAGMGTAGISHSSAAVSHPVEQGLLGIVEVFVDTIVICTLTGLVILCSGTAIPFGQDLGIQITADAFSAVFGNWVYIPIAICLCLFAFATILGWGLYGMRCVQFLFGGNAWKHFVFLDGLSVIFGSVTGTGVVWLLSETANGLMAIPNLMILLILTPQLVVLLKEYINIYDRGSVSGGIYENIKESESVRPFSYAEVSSAGG